MSDRKILSRLASVPAFPPVVARLLALLSNDASSMAEIAAAIASDPVFAGRILRYANSAAVERVIPAHNLLEAIVTLGVDRTREVALSTATLAYLGSGIKEKQLRRAWRHTVAAAVAASHLARACRVAPGEAYTTALMHDLGRLVLLSAYPAEYEEIMQRAQAEERPQSDSAGPPDPGNGCDHDRLLALEREYFGVDHAETGSELARRWRLPDSIVMAAGHHHEPPAGELDLLAVVQLACRLADLLGFTFSEAPSPLSFDDIAQALPAAAAEELWDAIPLLQEEISKQILFFSHTGNQLPARRLTTSIDERDAEELASTFRALPKPPAFPRAALVGAGITAAALALVLLALWR
jgi:HD-like signal output (HDOD) protein